MADILEHLSTALADRYRLERKRGKGGMATVFLAEDLKHGRKVAVKVLRPELGELLGADRFVREIRTTAQLQHPHILPLYDSGSTAAADGDDAGFLLSRRSRRAPSSPSPSASARPARRRRSWCSASSTSCGRRRSADAARLAPRRYGAVGAIPLDQD